MKFLITVIFLISSLNIKGQTVVFDNAKYLDFKLAFATDTTSAFGIDWKNENLVSEFELKGKIPLRYSVKIVNDTTASLSQFHNDKWTFQETITISGFTISLIIDNHIISKFKITDFDKDDDEDLIIWSHTNVNGNMWTSVYLNNPDKNRLEILKTTPDEENVWCAPDYDANTKIITSMQVSGNYGYSYTSTYKLENQIAIPLAKEESDNRQLNPLTGKGGILKYYTGKKGKWKLKQKINVQAGPPEEE